MNLPYKHIFFDLDHTIWDFEANSAETLSELYHSYGLKDRGVASPDFFIDSYKRINDRYWRQYRARKITKTTIRNRRFVDALNMFQINDKALALQMSDDYIAICPTKNKLLPYATETLDYLKEKYILHIITNGFSETQGLKLESANLAVYFDEIITSEEAGCTKPDLRIFQLLMDRTQCTVRECVMIGDNLEADIIGARNAGIDQIFYNPKRHEHEEEVTYEVSCLSEIRDIL